MCVYSRDFNNQCLKDSYTLPKIDQIAYETSEHEKLIFMDAYSGYNQIRMHLVDDDHITFYANNVNLCYKFMLFGPINARETYQIMVNKIFKEIIDKNMEVYVDDMLVKSIKGDLHTNDLREAFVCTNRLTFALLTQ